MGLIKPLLIVGALLTVGALTNSVGTIDSGSIN